MLNKITRQLVLVSVLPCLSVLALPVQAASTSAKVNITATVVDNSCTPSWADAGVDVALGRASLADFGSQGAVAQTKAFNLKLTDCGADTTKVNVTASGTADTSDAGAFANSSSETGAATGVGFTLWGDDSQSTQLTPDGLTSVEYAAADQAINMNFLAKIEQDSAATPTAGDAKSTVTLTINYE